MANKSIDKIQLLSPEKTPLTSPQKHLTSPSKFKAPNKFYDIKKVIESPIKSLDIKPTHNLYQTQIDSFTHKKSSIIKIESDDDSDDNSDEIIDNKINKINVKNNLW